MKKRILSILLLCCMVLTMLPTTVLAADGPMDTIPKYDVSIDVYNRTSDISIKDSRSYYIYSSVPDKLRDTWAWDKKIFIKGDKTAPHVFIDGVKLPYSRDQHHFSFSRIYIASDEDIPLRFRIEQSSYKTTLLGFNGTITITALD